MRWPWQRENPFAGRDFLDLVPEQAVPWRDQGDAGLVTLLAPRFSDPVLGRFLQPHLPEDRNHIRVALEARGSCLWRASDGRRAIRDLVPVYAAAFPEDSDQADERVCRWFHGMYINGFVRYVNLD